MKRILSLALLILVNASCVSNFKKQSSVSLFKQQNINDNEKHYLLAQNYFEANDFSSSLSELENIGQNELQQDLEDRVNLLIAKNYYSLGFSGQAIEYLDKISNESKIILSKKQLQLKIAQENDFELSVKSLSTEIQELISHSQN